ncbi:MAG: GGDEF domain-containing protein [Planctomycetota bacterium]
MRHSWRKGILPLAVGLVLGLAALVFAHLAGLAPEAWAATEFYEVGPLAPERSPAQGFSLFSLAFLAIPLAPFVAGRSLPVVNSPPLYAASWLLLPVGAVLCAYDLGWLTPALAERVGAASPARLQRTAFFAWPAAILLATLVPGRSSRAMLKGVTLVLGFVLLGAWACWLRFGPEDLSGGAGRWTLLAALAVAAVTAFCAWRTQAGVGGAVAAACAWCALAGLHAQGSGLDGLRELALEGGWVSAERAASWGDSPARLGRLAAQLLPAVWLCVLMAEWVQTLSHRTSYDALTEVHNKAFAESIVNQTSGVQLGRSYAVVVLDIDHFKKVNDRHGHGAGDDVLHAVAQGVQAIVGRRGTVCRTGGEEMTIFLPGFAKDPAKELAEEVRAGIEQLRIDTRNNKGKEQTLKVTLSLGIAANLDDAGQAVHKTVEETVAAADQAVYRAKRRGRNRVV